MRKLLLVFTFLYAPLFGISFLHAADRVPETLEELREAFQNPDSAQWGINPFWWWEGEPITRERITWQMETLSEKGVKNLTLIQRAPGHCDPAVFTDEWWTLLNYTLQEARRLGMRIFLSDHLGYGETGFMEQIITSLEDPGVWDVECLRESAPAGESVRLAWREGRVLGARAYPLLEGDVLDDKNSLDLSGELNNNRLDWTPPGGTGDWNIVVVLAVPPADLDEHYVPFSPEAARIYIRDRLDDLEARIPADMLGHELAGFFGDEHPHFPNYVYTEAIDSIYDEAQGESLARALPALFLDLGPDTVRYRTAYYQAAVEASERAYWRPVFEWCQARGLQYGNDQAERRNVTGQIDKYFDYVKTMRWYTAPGQDDPNDGPLGNRNYHGFKQAASIKELYGRSRVWNEGYYSSGVGIHPANHLAWLTEDTAYGANLYNPHNYFYSNRGATWTHTDGGWFWRQPYWAHYEAFSDYVTRVSMLASLGHLVTDVAIHYSAVSVQAQPLRAKGRQLEREPGDANGFMAVSEALFFANIDNLIIDDDTLLAAEVASSGDLVSGTQDFSTVIFGPESTIRLDVLRKTLELARSGGHVVFCGRLPTHSAENGADDPEVRRLLEQLLGSISASARIARQLPGGGSAAFFPIDFSALSRPGMLASPRLAGRYPKLYGVSDASKRGEAAFQKMRDQLAKVTAYLAPKVTPVFIQNEPELIIGFKREVAGQQVHMVQRLADHPVTLDAVFSERGIPQIWDPWTGSVEAVEDYQATAGGTRLRMELEDNLGYFIVFQPESAASEKARLQPRESVSRELPDDWTFSLQPTLDNRWGDFRLPASETLPPVEVATFRYREESGSGDSREWSAADYDDSKWEKVLYGVGPYWECAALKEALTNPERLGRMALDWQPVAFSKTSGLRKLLTFRGNIGYATGDGIVMPDFILDTPRPYAVFRTDILSPEDKQAGLRILLRQNAARLWVNGEEQIVEYGLGDLPLRQGRNTVVVALENAGRGQLYVTDARPVAASLQETSDPLIPPLIDAEWIREAGEPTWAPTRLRREFTLDAAPVDAHVTLTAFPDYRLRVNGELVLHNTRHYMNNEGSGNWLLPRSANITPLLKRGRNILEVAVALEALQYFGDTRWRPDQKKLVLALAARLKNGETVEILSDHDWPGATVIQDFARTPSSKTILKNREKAMATAEYPLGIHLDTPFLHCFEQEPDVIYDLRPEAAPRIGWFRFTVPPGTKRIHFPDADMTDVRVDGTAVPVKEGVVDLPTAPKQPASVALRMEMHPGAYAGAAFDAPVRITMDDAYTMPVGDWQELGLPTYSGIGIYRQTVSLSPQQLSGQMHLDLGTVGVSARVIVNGEPVGIRMSAPYRFDISDYIHEGPNRIEIEVANTTAPFFSTTPLETRRKTFAPYSGLLGPVRMIHEDRFR